MKKTLAIVLVIVSLNAFSQNRIYIADDTLQCKITEVSTDSIWYSYGGKTPQVSLKQIKYLEFAPGSRQLVKTLKVSPLANIKIDWLGFDFYHAKICAPGRKNDYMNNFYSDCNDLIYTNKQFDDLKKVITWIK